MIKTGITVDIFFHHSKNLWKVERPSGPGVVIIVHGKNIPLTVDGDGNAHSWRAGMLKKTNSPGQA
jgi:hypothetical protein